MSTNQNQTTQLDLSDLDELFGPASDGTKGNAADPLNLAGREAAATSSDTSTTPDRTSGSAGSILSQLANPTEVVDPWGECISLTDPDSLIDAYERISNFDAKCFAVKQQIRQALGNLTEGDAKTRRVQGKRRKAKVEFPGTKWDQSKLKEAWNSYPQLRDQVLKIDTIGVKSTEYKKLVNTAGAPEVETFRNIVTSAASESDALPTVKVEQ